MRDQGLPAAASPVPPTAATRTGVGLAAAAFAFSSQVAFAPSVATPPWTAKAALLPALAAVGLLTAVTRPARDELHAARWLARCFLAVAVVSTASSPRIGATLLGRYAVGTGLVFVVALSGAWELGLRASLGDRRLVAKAVVGGAALNAVIAMAQMATDLSSYGLPRFEARATGLMGNPVYFAALPLVAVALLVAVLSRSLAAGRMRVAGVVALGMGAFAAAMSLTASRIALVLSCVLALWAFRHGARVGIVVVTVLALGWLAGPLLDRPTTIDPGAPFSSEPTALTSVTGETTSVAPAPDDETSRLSGVGATVSPSRGFLSARLHTWTSMRHAVAERPLLGTGPGQFFGAGVRHRTRAAERGEPGRYFADAHNIVVEYLTTTGILGVAALLGWVVLAGRRASGPWAVAAGLVFVQHLVEPQHVTLTPLAFLMLGLAGGHRRTESAPVPWHPAARGLLVSAGVVAGAVLLVGDFDLRQAELDYRLAPALRAERLLSPWSQPAIVLSHIHTFNGSLGSPLRRSTADPEAQANDRRARHWMLVAAQRQPEDVPLWTALADIEYAQGDLTAARRHYLHALSLNPWAVRPLGGMGNIAVAQGRDVEARRWYRRARDIDPSLTEPGERLRGLTGRHRATP